MNPTQNDFQYFAEQFADIRILRFNVEAFNTLSLNRKIYIYYLSQAALAGRDILFDQHYRHNLLIRFVLEQMVRQLNPDHRLNEYLKRVWFSSGIHHHYSTLKLKPDFSSGEFEQWFFKCNWQSWFSVDHTQALHTLISNILFNNSEAIKRVWNAPGDDLVVKSCNNFYCDVTQKEATEFYASLKQTAGDNAPSFGLNSQLIKENGQLKEIKWHLHGKYGKAIRQIVNWLNKAKISSENSHQTKAIGLLIDFYTTGDLKVFDQYNIEWLADHESQTDFINGFIEVYADPLGIKGTWESMVNITDEDETHKTAVISEQAQWFEDHSPVDAQFKKPHVKGVSMKIIHAVTLGGDCYPASPLGINLPNADWIREKHGSKSVSLSNISESHQQASLASGVIEEFAYNVSEIELHKQYGAMADHLHTHLHECVGHGSGRMLPGITSEMLKSNASVIEEARADLFGLYFIADPMMMDLKLVPHPDVAITQYNNYIRNGLMVQLTRIEPGQKIEQAHMRNRQLICRWVFEKGQKDRVIERFIKNGKTYFKINNYSLLRELFGQLLKEVQRIKSEGDEKAAAQLVETYGVDVDVDLHREVLERYSKLNLAPFTGFINPVLSPVLDAHGNITNIAIDYTETFEQQMFRYSDEFGFLTNESIQAFIHAL
jgi:dipeptidyl-peptidase-3